MITRLDLRGCYWTLFLRGDGARGSVFSGFKTSNSYDWKNNLRESCHGSVAKHFAPLHIYLYRCFLEGDSDDTICAFTDIIALFCFFLHFSLSLFVLHSLEHVLIHHILLPNISSIMSLSPQASPQNTATCCLYIMLTPPAIFFQGVRVFEWDFLCVTYCLCSSFVCHHTQKLFFFHLPPPTGTT